MGAVGALRIRVKVVPNASREEICGWLGEELKVRVAQPPEAGKANRRVESLIAEKLGGGKVDVRVVAGTSSPRKVVEIRGLDAKSVTALLQAHTK